MKTKPLYLLIKLDVDGEVVFDYKDAENYAKNFCNSMEFELIDHCLEETENNDLYIGYVKEEVWPWTTIIYGLYLMMLIGGH